MESESILWTRSPVKCREPSVPLVKRNARHRSHRSPTLTSNPEAFQKNLHSFTTSLFDDDQDHGPQEAEYNSLQNMMQDGDSMISSIHAAQEKDETHRTLKPPHNQLRVHFMDEVSEVPSAYHEEMLHTTSMQDELVEFASFLLDIPSQYQPPSSRKDLVYLASLSATDLTKHVMREHVDLMNNKHLVTG